MQKRLLKEVRGAGCKAVFELEWDEKLAHGFGQFTAAYSYRVSA